MFRKQLIPLILKDIKLEWRQKYAFNGILLYLLIIVFVVFLSFETINENEWIVLYWIIMLFTSVNALAKSFIAEGKGRELYYYSLASPQAVILAKIIYNMMVMGIVAVLGTAIYALAAGFPVADIPAFSLAILLGLFSFALVFSLISSVASKASNSSTLMTILSFPLILPILKILIDLSRSCLIKTSLMSKSANLLTLLSLDILILAMALILFPYLWQE